MIDINELKEKLKSVKLLSDDQVTEIVNAVIARLNPVKNLSEEEHVYTDEPIGAPLHRDKFERIRKDDAAEERIAAMRKIPFERANRGKLPDEIFFLQAKYMADFEDNYTPPFAEHSDFRRQELGRYFSGFQSMSVKSLRVYYTWRTKLRGGELLRTSLTNAFIYATELIHCIGYESKEDAYEALRAFTEHYSELDSRFSNFGKKWLKDFAVFYDLPASLVTENGSAAESIKALSAPFIPDDDALYSAIKLNSSYNPENSRFMNAHPNDSMHVVCRVYRAVMASDRKEAFRHYVGTFTESAYDLFGAAMFCARNCSGDRAYRADGLTNYVSRNGKWYVERLTRTAKQNQELGRLLKNIDHVMRVRWKFASKIKPDGLTEELTSLINEEIDEYLAEKRIIKRQSIKLDLDKLPLIRSSADETAELLLTEEDIEAEQTLSETHAVAMPEETEEYSPTAEENKNDLDLPKFSDAEKVLLNCLINGEPYSEKLQLLGVLPSIAADSLNEKLMDRFMDTVIVDTGNGFELIEDYIEDLKGIVDKL